jgi:uncharacterized membrane protein
MIKALETKLYYARRFTWGAYFLLIVNLLAAGADAQMYSLMIVSVLPLLIFLPGMARENYKSLSLLCFVTLFYFIVVVVNLGGPDPSLYDVFSLILIVVLFIAAMMFSRWKQHALARAGAPQSPNGPPES